MEKEKVEKKKAVKKKAKAVSLADVNAVLDRIARRQEEADRLREEQQKEADRLREEQQKTADRLLEEQQKEADRRQKEYDRRREEYVRWREEYDRRQDKLSADIDKLVEQNKATGLHIDKMCKKVGGIDENIGHHAEQFFQSSFADTLTFGGEKYDYMISNLKYQSKNDGVEFDIVLVNGKSVALIEAKNRIHPSSVRELAEKKVAKFRKFSAGYPNHKIYLGIAGFSFCDEVLDEAQRYGMGIIRQDGQSIDVKADYLKAY